MITIFPATLMFLIIMLTTKPSALVSMYQGPPMRPVFNPKIPPPPLAGFSRPPPPFGVAEFKLVEDDQTELCQEIISTYAKLL